MSARTSFTIILVILTFLASFTSSDEIGRYIYHFCPNTTTFTRNSTYFTNLQTLFSSLQSQPAFFSAGFHSATVGHSPDTVTGLFLCQGGDSPEEVCRACVNYAVYDVLANYCPNEKEATIWYNPCMLRYSHRNILSTLTTEPNAMLNEEANVTSSLLNRFKEVLFVTLNETAVEAANSSTKLAVKSANYTSNGSIHTLLQCTPDLTRDQCFICLKKAISGFSGERVGARSLLPSCGARYEPLSFFDENAVRTGPPSSASASRQATEKRRKSSVTIASVSITIAVAVLLLSAGGFFLAKRARKTYDAARADDEREDDIKTVESMQFDFQTLADATKNFSKTNRIGKGGFGEVYKGIFPDGTEVAVKRLSKTSSQGLQEFKNEVLLVAKLQHKNLVKLLGFCLEREEKILVYEFVPNKSLDYFLFDPTKKSSLNWTTRYNVIRGIARGLLYLHQDSRLTIIHRDLKSGNILLDANMNPKVSDFGMARIFGVDQTQANTRRVVGTYGYMPPEYAMHGHFSMKSDVYSFGVLVLEIVSGKRNSSFCLEDNIGNLVTYAWTFWRNRTMLELVDPAIGESYQTNEVIRCIHIALLCVQEHPGNRPTSSTIVTMLTSDTVTLPVPQPPGFLLRSGQKTSLLRAKGSESSDQSSSMSKSIPCSVDDASITNLYPR